MSHNVHYRNIRFANEALLRAAVAELLTSDKGVFEVGNPTVTARGYSGRTAQVDAVIRLPGQSYDIGFKKDAEGIYSPFFEAGFRPVGLAADPGSETVEGKACQYDPQGAMLGKLQQRYAVLVAEQNARRDGLSSRRVQGEKGQIALKVYGGNR